MHKDAIRKSSVTVEKAAVGRIAAALVEESCWFQVMPLPFDHYEISVRDDRRSTLESIAKEIGNADSVNCRILVAVTPDGLWDSVGWGSAIKHDRKEHDDRMLQRFNHKSDLANVPVAIRWVEFTQPIPAVRDEDDE